MASTKKMDAIALLKADHRKVEALFAKFEKAKDAKVKKALAAEICTELSVHAMIEEEIFYPACRDAVEDDLRTEAYVEHDGAKILIAELANSDPSNEFYKAKMTVLSEQIKHHVKEEEKPGEGFFAQARKADIDISVNSWPRASLSFWQRSSRRDCHRPKRAALPDTRSCKGSPW